MRSIEQQTFLRVLHTKWRKKSTGIDMERLLRHCHPMYTQVITIHNYT